MNKKVVLSDGTENRKPWKSMVYGRYFKRQRRGDSKYKVCNR